MVKSFLLNSSLFFFRNFFQELIQKTDLESSKYIIKKYLLSNINDIKFIIKK